MEKASQLGAKVIACSDSNGVLYDENGINLDTVKRLKEVERKRIKEYADIHKSAKYQENGCIWDIACDVALPCATQNEINADNAKSLVKNGCKCVAEGANMPTTPEAIDVFLNANILYAPGKATNAGGVATSALEMQQNASRDSWDFEYTDGKLKNIMTNIHNTCYSTAEEYGFKGNYFKGANIAGFVKVAETMIPFGLI